MDLPYGLVTRDFFNMDNLKSKQNKNMEMKNMNTNELDNIRVITVNGDSFLGYVNTNKKVTTVSKAMKCSGNVSSGEMAKYLEVEVNGRYTEVNFVGEVQFVNRPLTADEKEQFQIHMITMSRAIRDMESHYTIELFRALRNGN